jgi:predicted DCC family thiol-disulfide oxidoreductase YuxK
MNDTEKERLNVYFNGACPVCKAGINSQKSKSTACVIEWKDVHQENNLADEINKDLSTVRKYLHVTDSEAKQHIGINAFILLWKNSPKERWKAKLFSLPIITQFAQLGYYIFANILYCWNKSVKNW